MINTILQSFNLFELMVIVGTVVLLSLMVTEYFDVTHLLLSVYDSKECNYGYGLRDGEWLCN